jgi:hypothetical protein
VTDRTTTNCSACGAALREYAQRLICDQCRALFVPRCATALRACEVRIDAMLVATALTECPRHGLQLAPGDFADVLAHSAEPTGGWAKLRKQLLG